MPAKIRRIRPEKGESSRREDLIMFFRREYYGVIVPVRYITA